MERLVRYFRGYVRAAVRGVHPERVLNACAEAGIPVREAEPAEDYLLRITVPERHFKRVQALAERCQCTAEPEKRGGAPKLLRRVRRHRLLLALLALCVAAALASSLFVWDVQVTGNETVSTGTILRELEAYGVKPGSYWPHFSNDLIRNHMILKIPELQWLAVQIRGSCAEVVVREKTPKPEVVDNDEPVSLYAGASGFILSMEVLGGEARVAPGDLVTEGELLVSGAVRDLGGGVRGAHALGSIRARTLYELTAEQPLTRTVKTQSGRAKNRWALVAGKKRINFYQSSGISDAECDKINFKYAFSIPGVFTLPVSLVHEQVQPYETQEIPVPPEEARAALEQALTQQLQARIGADGEIVSAAFTATERDGALIVTLRAECEQEIGVSRAISPEEMQQLQAQTEEGTTADD